MFQSRKLIEPIGKYDFFTRVYDPETGRFQQRDRQGYVDGTNLYSFLGNNPLTYTDPFGQGREESNNVQYIQIKGNADGWRPNNHESGVLGFFYTAFVGGRGANGDRRYRLLTPDQQIARGLMDKKFGCTLCHLSTEIWNRYGPAAFNPENNLPYDWAINKQGLQDWEDMSARARFWDANFQRFPPLLILACSKTKREPSVSLPDTLI